jgi:integrase
MSTENIKKSKALKLTKAIVDGATFGGTDRERFVLWDTEVKGFGCRVYPSGKKAFIYRYRMHDQTKFITIGPYGVLTLDTARVMAKQLTVRVYSGEDPLRQKQIDHVLTFENLCDEYMEKYAKKHKRSWAQDESRIRRVLKPTFGKKPIGDIYKQDIVRLHSRMGADNGPYEANRTLVLMSGIFNQAVELGLIHEDSKNPAKGIKQFPEIKRRRYVTKDEMPRLLVCIAKEKNYYAATAVWLYLLTGLRKMEVLTLRWENVDFNAEQLTVPTTKNGDPMVVPFSEALLAAMQAIKRVPGCPWVLPGQNGDKHLVNISKPWGRIRKAAMVEDVRIHDLRRTLGSWLIQSGYTRDLIGELLNQKTREATKIYTIFENTQRKDALNSMGGQLLALKEVSYDT